MTADGATKWRLLLMVGGLLLAGGCRPPEAWETQTEVRDGRLYVLDAAEPFTGVVLLGFPDSVAADSGAVARRAPYRDGLMDGVVRGFYPSGAVFYEQPMENGVREGERTEYFKSGAVRERSTFVADLEQGVRRGWSEDGTLVLQQEVVDGKPQGLTLTWYPSGARRSEEEYLRGALHGTLRRWYESGQLRLEREYRNGFPHGATREWHPDGTPLAEGTYADGHLHGRYRKWYPNGSLQLDAEYHRGRTFEIRIWDEKGDPVPIEPDLRLDTVR